MKWRQVSTVTAVSDCGQYEIHMSRHPGSGKTFYNAWCGDKHVSAGFEKAQVKAECESHKAKWAVAA